MIREAIENPDTPYYDYIRHIIRQGKELGVYLYIYTGGEPLVRKKDLIALCEKHFDCVFLSFTNGTLIDEAFANEMLRVVNAVSIIAVFLIIALVEKSISLPFILIAVIELAIFINLGLPHYLGQSLPLIAPICISTFGVALYSNIDIISSMCMLMDRGAVISVLTVLFVLPALLLLCDRLICATIMGMTHGRTPSKPKKLAYQNGGI